MNRQEILEQMMGDMERFQAARRNVMIHGREMVLQMRPDCDEVLAAWPAGHDGKSVPFVIEADDPMARRCWLIFAFMHLPDYRVDDPVARRCDNPGAQRYDGRAASGQERRRIGDRYATLQDAAMSALILAGEPGTILK